MASQNLFLLTCIIPSFKQGACSNTESTLQDSSLMSNTENISTWCLHTHPPSVNLDVVLTIWHPRKFHVFVKLNTFIRSPRSSRQNWPCNDPRMTPQEVTTQRGCLLHSLATGASCHSKQGDVLLMSQHISVLLSKWVPVLKTGLNSEDTVLKHVST